MARNELYERRNFVRAKRVLSIEHKLKKRNSKTIVSTWSLSTTQDMSLGGLTFYSETEYKKNDTIELKVLMSGVLEIFNGLAKVLRVEKTRSSSYHLIAVSFLKNTKKSRNAKSYIKN